MVTPKFTPSPCRTSAVVNAAVHHYNTASNNPVETPFLLFWSCIRYYWLDISLLGAPQWKMETDPSKPPFPFCRVVHHWLFSAQCDQYFSPAYLLLPSSLSHISSVIVICRLLHHLTYFLFPVSSPLFHISDVSVLITPYLYRHLLCHTCPPSLSYIMSTSDALINLRLLWHSHPLPSPSSCIYAYAILIVLHLFRVAASYVSTVLRLYHCRASFLRPRSVLISHYSWVTQPGISGTACQSVSSFRYNWGYVFSIPFIQQPAVVSGCQSYKPCLVLPSW